jgi:hypothetical protein
MIEDSGDPAAAFFWLLYLCMHYLEKEPSWAPSFEHGIPAS